MTRNEIILVMLGIVALVAVLLAARSGGPRVTQIDIRREKDKESDEGGSHA
jgi:NAD/NADP transhydrogenase alpha subunit